MTPRPARHIIRAWLRLWGFHGITLPPWGIYILAERLGDERLVRHESRHWEQAREHGVLKWYALYIWYTLRYGYQNNPFEVDARKA